MLPLSEGALQKRNPQMVIGTHQNAPATTSKAVAKREIRVSSSTQAKPVKTKNGTATIAKQQRKRDKRIELCIERRPMRHVLSTICSEEDRMATTKETFQSAILLKCGKTLLYKRKDLRWASSSGDRRTTALQTPRVGRICINRGLNKVKKPRVAACELHKSIYKIRGAYRENNED